MEGKMADTLYKRLGGYDAIAAVADDLLVRRQADPRLAHFWQHRSEGSLLREKQTLINFLCASAGGPLYYVGRDLKVSHKGLGIDESDWQAFTGHLDATLDNFEVPAPERAEVLSFINSTKPDILAQSPASRA
jgi:hemoglobin